MVRYVEFLQLSLFLHHLNLGFPPIVFAKIILIYMPGNKGASQYAHSVISNVYTTSPQRYVRYIDVETTLYAYRTHNTHNVILTFIRRRPNVMDVI